MNKKIFDVIIFGLGIVAAGVGTYVASSQGASAVNVLTLITGGALIGVSAYHIRNW